MAALGAGSGHGTGDQWDVCKRCLRSVEGKVLVSVQLSPDGAQQFLGPSLPHCCNLEVVFYPSCSP